MPNHKSAAKRIRQTVKRQLNNRVSLGQMRTALKKARAAVAEGAENTDALVRSAVARIDKAVTKGVLKRRTAARYISRLAHLANTKNKN